MKTIAPAFASIALIVTTSVCALAADTAYPTRPLRLVTGFTAGGGSDIIARALSEHFAAHLGQPVVVDNRPGAAGHIAAETVAKAPPDGYTLLLPSGSNAVAPSLHRKLAYDITRDFAFVGMVAEVPLMLAINPGVPAHNPGELVAYARSRARDVNFASSGIGTPSHLASELFKQMAGFEATHVPYKGSSAALVDLIAGRVQFYFTSFPGSIAHVRAGKLRAIGVSSAKRSVVLPEVPTLNEAGIKGYRAGSWYGLAFPRGVPPVILSRFHNLLQQGLSHTEIKSKFTDQGLVVLEGVSPSETTKFVTQEVARWAEVTRRAGLAPGP
jgi:tripartite-type tricarboxylate transporter receptor subunit TctC